MKAQAALEVGLPVHRKNACMSDVAEEPVAGGSDMGGAKRMAGVARELTELNEMTVGELAERYKAVFGESTRTRNKQFLRKKVAYRIQELAEGGLSPRALERIEQLATIVPARWRQPLAQTKTGATVSRDPRLPPAGTEITRVHDGVEHKVIVLDDGFEHRGKRHRSLSRIAKLITGVQWNGFLYFFGRGAGAR